MVRNGFLISLRLGVLLVTIFCLTSDMHQRSLPIRTSKLLILIVKHIQVHTFFLSLRHKNIGICNRYGIRSYPTIQFHGKDKSGKQVKETYSGDYDWRALVEFYEDIKSPSVVKLDAKIWREGDQKDGFN